MGELINGRTPEEIKQGLEWMTNGCPTPETDCEECRHHEICKEITSVYTPGDALAYIKRLEAKRPKWISVEEQPPEFPCLYWDGVNQIGITKSLATITLKSGKTVYLSDMFLRAFPDIKQSDVDSCTHILYWMPLPELPEEE